MAPIIQVAIGILFVFSIISLLVTQMNTFIGNLLNWRAKNLKEGVILLVSDKEMQAKILAHPLIKLVDARLQSLALAEPVPSADPNKGMEANYEDIINAPTTKVSNIEPSTFVEALISILSSQGGTAIFDLVEQGIDALPNDDLKLRLRQQLRDLKSFSNTDTTQLRQTIMQLPDGDHRNLLSYALESAEDALGRASIKSGQMIPLLEGINKIGDQLFRDALKTILTTAQSLDDARNKLESWFNDGMGRASDLYRTKIAYVSFFIGLLIAVVLNIDTLHLAKSLWNDQTLRESVAAVANNAVQNNTLAIPTAAAPSDNSQQVPSASAAPDAAEATAQSATALQKTLTDLLSLNLPIGWEYVNVNDELKQDCVKAFGTATASDVDIESCVQNSIQSQIDSGLGDPRDNTRNFWTLLPGSGNWLTNLIWKIIGLVVTAIAAAQGAPFWFDLLKRLTGGGQNAQAAPVINVAAPPAPVVNIAAPAPVVQPPPEPETIYRNADILMPDDTSVG
ncbi:MAG: hypothetical protein GC179_03730 [Anaerolineaceae bacterium]|nr:hypothetical protein [Anaerolineaceae bacterium]